MVYYPYDRGPREDLNIGSDEQVARQQYLPHKLHTGITLI